MHGLIFATLAQFVAGQLPAEEAERWRALEFDGDSAYPDAEFEALLVDACAATRQTRKEFLRAFGEYTARTTFVQLYPQYYEASPDTRTFLLHVEETIHELVRRSIPGAYPPRLAVRALGNHGVVVSYTSERMLCALLEGLVVGTAGYYGEQVAIEQPACMERGDSACAFVIEPAPRAA